MFKSKSVLSLFLLFAFSTPVQADWEGAFKVTSTGGKNMPEVTGLMRMKKDKVLLDAKKPTQAATLVNLKARKAWTLLHPQKMVMEINLSQIESYSPVCPANDIDACLKKKNFTITGTETANGHSCTVYETDTNRNGKKTHIKLWKPNDLSEVPMVKSIVTVKPEQTTETNIENIRTVAQADSYFTIPKDYHSMGNAEDLLKSFGKGFSGIKIPGQ